VCFTDVHDCPSYAHHSRPSQGRRKKKKMKMKKKKKKKKKR